MLSIFYFIDIKITISMANIWFPFHQTLFPHFHASLNIYAPFEFGKSFLTFLNIDTNQANSGKKTFRHLPFVRTMPTF